MEENLLQKRAKLIECQNQISWISSEFVKIDKKNRSSAIVNQCELLRINLLSIMEYLKISDLVKYLTKLEKKEINQLLHLMDMVLDNMYGRLCSFNKDRDL